MRFSGAALERARGDLSREKLGRLADVSASLIFKIERGIVDPGATKAARLAEALNVPLADLFTTDDEEAA